MSHDAPTGWVKPARSLVTAAGRAIGLVDDVFTTGAAACACSLAGR